MKSEREGINPSSKPSGTGCVECMATAAGGSIYADAPSVVTSVAATVHQISTHQSTHRLPDTRSLQVSSQASGGFMITARGNFLSAQN